MRIILSLFLLTLSACVPVYEAPSPHEVMKAGELIDQGTFYLRTGNLSAARAAYELSLELSYSPEALDGLGTVAFHENNVVLAETFFLKALSLDPEYSEAASNLALLYEKEGLPERAIPLYERALRFDPQNFRARNNFAALLADYGIRTGKDEREKRLIAARAKKELQKALTLASHPVIRQNEERLRTP